MSIEFERETQVASFNSPLEDFEPVDVEVEVRTDPLTGATARIVPEAFLTPDDAPDIEAVVADDEGCFFCPDAVADVTPTYPDWVGFDRGSVGEATSFPNLNPYGAHSNVVVLTEAHYTPIDGFSVGRFEDGLDAALEFVGAALDFDEGARIASVNMNFLRPAGSSIVHPHLQTLVDARGTTEQRRRFEAARSFRERTGEGYWSALLAAERGGERHLGSTGETEWLAPFAPRHHRHVRGLPAFTGVPALGEPVVGEIAAGLVAVLDGYGGLGLNSFNWSISLAEGRRPVVDVIARSVFDRYYWSDSPFFASLHDEGVVDVAPEAYAAELAGGF